MIKSSRKYNTGLTLIGLLIGLAILFLIVVGTITISNIGKGTEAISTGGGSSASSGGPALNKLTWISWPLNDEFEKNTNATYVVQLQEYKASSMAYEGYKNQSSLVGAVVPASVSIISINGAPPGASQPIPSGISLVTGSGNLYQASTGNTGDIKIVLKGSEPADGQLTVIYVPNSGNPIESTKTFSVYEN